MPVEIHKESRTALAAASIRAHHFLHDSPHIFSDHIAQWLLTPEEESFFAQGRCDRLKSLDPHGHSDGQDIVASVSKFMRRSADASEMLSRARFAEDLLIDGHGSELSQYVILGSGMDSFALRHEHLGDSLSVFEVDRASVLAFKAERLEVAGFAPPKTVRSVPIDFTRDGLFDSLAVQGFSSQERSFLSWMGSTQYLDHDRVIGMCQAIAANTPSGSRLVFDYFDHQAYDADCASPRMTELITRLRSIEPLQCGFDPGDLEAHLASSGFSVVEHMHPDEIQRRYFADRGDGYTATEHAHFVCVEVS